MSDPKPDTPDTESAPTLRADLAHALTTARDGARPMPEPRGLVTRWRDWRMSRRFDDRLRRLSQAGHPLADRFDDTWIRQARLFASATRAMQRRIWRLRGVLLWTHVQDFFRRYGLWILLVLGLSLVGYALWLSWSWLSALIADLLPPLPAPASEAPAGAGALDPPDPAFQQSAPDTQP